MSEYVQAQAVESSNRAKQAEAVRLLVDAADVLRKTGDTIAARHAANAISFAESTGLLEDFGIYYEGA